MHSAVTGYRKGSTSAVRCVDVAALVAAAILRKNPTAEVIPFRDNIVDDSSQSARFGDDQRRKAGILPSGGTNCSAPLRELNRRKGEG